MSTISLLFKQLKFIKSDFDLFNGKYLKKSFKT